MGFTATTQLQAVNTMLGTIGEAPVDSLTGLSTTDASMALSVLNEVTQDFMSEGFYFNTDKNVLLPIDLNGNIWLASNVASIEIDRTRLGGQIEPVMRYAANGLPQLYDRRNQTSVFTAPVWATKIVYWLDWVQMPESARGYCKIKAARIFADRTVGAETVHQFTADDEKRALIQFKADNGESPQLNIFNSPDVSDWLYRGGKGQGFRW